MYIKRKDKPLSAKGELKQLIYSFIKSSQYLRFDKDEYWYAVQVSDCYDTTMLSKEI